MFFVKYTALRKMFFAKYTALRKIFGYYLTDKTTSLHKKRCRNNRCFYIALYAVLLYSAGNMCLTILL